MCKIDPKVGETYYVRVQVTEKFHDKIITRTVSDKGSPLVESYTIFFDNEAPAFSPVRPPAPIAFFKSTWIPEAYPKYDPCRLFREGDKAKPRIINGREIPKMPLDVIFTVTGDEDEYGAVPVEYLSPVRGLLTSTTVHAVWLELVTPVEELGPYVVRHNEVHSAWSIYGPFNLSATNYFYGERYPYTKETAKEAAEAECDRLNAEHRKEL